MRLAAALSILLLAAPALARQDNKPDSKPDTSAEPAQTGPEKAGDEPSLIAQGVALRLQGHDAAAFEVFSHAWERFRTPRAQAQLGLAAQALGRWTMAETHLAGALQSDDAWVAGKRKPIEDALVVVRKRLGSLEVLADVDGAEVLVDGKSMGRLPLAAPLRLPAGTVVLQVQAGGHVPVQRSVMVEGGQLARESFQLVKLTPVIPLAPAAAAPAAPSAPPLLNASDQPAPAPLLGSGDTRRRRVLYGAIGLTVAGAALTTWSGLDTLSARDRYVERPTEMGYTEGIGRQRRTNLLLLGTGLVAASALAWALITDWGAP
jgi:PEGA domain